MKAYCKTAVGSAGGATPCAGSVRTEAVRGERVRAGSVSAESRCTGGVSKGVRRGRSPYDVRSSSEQPRGRLARAGMTVVEMVVWLVVMAALSLGMLWLLWTCSR